MTKLFYCLILALFMTVIQASERLDCLEFHVIKNAPLGFKNAENVTTGVHAEYMIALEKETGLCINIALLPYARIWESIKHGKHDGGIIFKSESRSDLVKYVALVRTVKTAVIPSNGVTINNYNDLYDLRIGQIRGTHLSKKFDKDSKLTIIELINDDQAAKMIKHGYLDAIAAGALVISYQLRKNNALDKVALLNMFPLGEKEQWLQLSKKSRHLDKIPTLKKAINKLRKDGTFDKIMEKYYGEQWRQINQ